MNVNWCLTPIKRFTKVIPGRIRHGLETIGNDVIANTRMIAGHVYVDQARHQRAAVADNDRRVGIIDNLSELLMQKK